MSGLEYAESKLWCKLKKHEQKQYLAGDLKKQVISELIFQRNAKQSIPHTSQEIRAHYELQLNQHLRKAPYVSNQNATLNTVSTTGRYQAMYSNNNGADFLTLRILDLIDYRFLNDLLHVKFASAQWSSNDEYLIYATDRDHRNGGTNAAIKAHRIGEFNSISDEVIWEGSHEPQWPSWFSVGKTDYLMISDDKSNEVALYTMDFDERKVGAKLWSTHDKVTLIMTEDTYL